MHKKILTKEQVKLFPLFKKISKDFGLVGGTAIALHIGHRESIDFDFFSREKFNNQAIKRKLYDTIKIDKILVNKLGEYTFISNGVKITFFNYLFDIKYKNNIDGIIKIPDLLTLAAMKAYVLGQRVKWKDYVDLYFILKDFFSIDEIIKKSEKIFKEDFNAKLFRIQLSYFSDIDYSEKIVYLKGYKISDKKIKEELIKFSLS